MLDLEMIGSELEDEFDITVNNNKLYIELSGDNEDLIIDENGKVEITSLVRNNEKDDWDGDGDFVTTLYTRSVKIVDSKVKNSGDIINLHSRITK